MAELRETLAEKIAPLKGPIPGGEPQGADASYEPEFEEVKAEIDKLGSLDGEQPNWGRVASVSAEILQNKSKDMRLVTWLAVARMVQSGPAGLAEGLLGILEVSREHWDGMYPPAKRARARGNLASWLAEQAESVLAEYKPTAADREAVALCDTLYGEVDDFLSEKLGENYTGMGALRSALREKSRELPAEAPPPKPAAPQAQPQAAAPASPPAAAAPPPAAFSIETAADADKAFKEMRNDLRKIAQVLRSNATGNALAYRICRFANWAAFNGAPAAEQNKTLLPPPPPDRQADLNRLLEAGNWAGLIEAAEAHAAAHLWWLDPMRYIATALDRLGPSGADAREVVGRETVAFVERIPSLVNLKFNSGMDFADAATKAWLEEEQAKYVGAAGPGAATSAAAEEDAQLAERFEVAKNLVKAGEVGEGLAVAIALASRGADARTRFRARLAAARLAIQGSQLAIARPILEGLAREVEQFGLEEWEPRLAVDVFASLLICLQAVKDRPSGPTPPGTKAEPRAEVARFSELFDKLCRLDPAAAMGLAG
ncbi:MAG: type VI secretion system protein TssA [Polyangiaceae bacterium]